MASTFNILLLIFSYSFRIGRTDWSVFGGNTAHTGYVNIHLVQDNGHSSLLWTQTLTASLTYATIADNHYYTISSTDHILYVLDAFNGTIQNYIDIGSAYRIGPPIVSFNEQIITQKVGSSAGIYINSYAINNNYQNQWNATGSAQWATYPYGVTPSHTENIVYFAGGQYNDRLYAVDSHNGSQLFESIIPTGYGCDFWTPTVYKGKVFMHSQPGQGNEGFFREVNATTGETLWEQILSSEWDGYSTYWVPSITNDIAVVSSRSRSNGVITFSGYNIVSRAHLWDKVCNKPQVTDAGSFKDYTAATDGINAFVVCSDGIYALSLTTGSSQLKYNCTDCVGQPIITIDSVIVNSKSGVKLFLKSNGKLMETLDSSGMIALNENVLYVTNSNDGKINAYLLRVSMGTDTHNGHNGNSTVYPANATHSSPINETRIIPTLSTGSILSDNTHNENSTEHPTIYPSSDPHSSFVNKTNIAPMPSTGAILPGDIITTETLFNNDNENTNEYNKNENSTVHKKPWINMHQTYALIVTAIVAFTLIICICWYKERRAKYKLLLQLKAQRNKSSVDPIQETKHVIEPGMMVDNIVIDGEEDGRLEGENSAEGHDQATTGDAQTRTDEFIVIGEDEQETIGH